MEKNVWAVYIIQSISKPERVYIGSSVDYGHRIKSHKSCLKYNKHSSPQLQNHYNKYGEGDLVFEVIESNVFIDIVHLLAREQSWYWRYRSKGRDIPFFNVNEITGSTLGYKHKPEMKKQIGDSLRGKPKPPMSQKTKDLISIAKKGITSWNKGISPKPETIEKYKKSMKGFRHSEETKKRISETMRGVPKSKESIEKLKKARKGFTLSQESRNKVSETLKMRYKEHPEWREAISKRQQGKKKGY